MVVYIVRGVRTEVRIAPTDFDPALATQADLSRFGLPPAPTDAADRPAWLSMMRNWKRNVDATLCEQPNIRFDPADLAYITDQGGGNGAASYNWAGNALANAAPGTYVAVQGDFVQPTKGASCSGAALADWVGLGANSPARIKMISTADASTLALPDAPTSNTAFPDVFYKCS